MSIWMLYVAELALIAAAIPTMLWLKREGDRNWREHRRRMVSVHLIVNIAQMSAALATVSAAMSPMVAAAADFERSLAKVTAAIRSARPTTAGGDGRG